jgi:hypothetical protein
LALSRDESIRDGHERKLNELHKLLVVETRLPGHRRRLLGPTAVKQLR